MTELRFETYTMPAADLGPTDPLPDIVSTTDVHSEMALDETITEEEAQYFKIGQVSTILPYLKLNGFNRVKIPREFDSAVLENRHLKAVFLPGLGGRLWSLYDKGEERELLHVNPVFQPTNLALRGAWISGGVEWNIGMTGHSPFTVSPMFTATTELTDGTPVLRMYEWERVRGAAFQIDAYLPEDSKFLFFRMRIRNTGEETVPMYWWSNIAVDETTETRVLAPASRAYRFNYGSALSKIDFPIYEGIDASYSTNLDRAIDFFFDIPEPRRRFITALDEKGTGLVQTSTDRLQGRKLFLWGMGSGGRRWQEFLAKPGCAYIEIQAGLAHTQMEHLLMPGEACWDWMEAYGLLNTDPAIAHGENWDAAWDAVDSELESRLPRRKLDEELERLSRELDAKAIEPTAVGSGWGALERRRLAKAGLDFNVGNLSFGDDSLGPEQIPWLELLEKGILPCPDVDEKPVSWLIQDEWFDLLKTSIEREGGDHWFSRLNLGVMHYVRKDFAAAKEAWRRSLDLRRSGWAAYCMAVLISRHEGDEDGGAALYIEASRMLPEELQPAIRCGEFLIQTGRTDAYLSLLPDLSPAVRENGRIRFFEARAAYHIEELDRAEKILMDGLVVDDTREGEISLSELWLQIQAKRLSGKESIDFDIALERVKRNAEIPTHLDFRMNTDE